MSAILLCTPIRITAISIVNRILLSFLFCFFDNPAFRNEANIPISTETYSRLNLTYYLWSMMYFAIYAYFALQLLELVLLFLSITLVKLVLTNGQPGGMIAVIVYSAGVVSCIHVLLLRPYIELLKACVSFPTKQMNRIKCIEAKAKFAALRRAISTFGPALPEASEGILRNGLIVDNSFEFLHQRIYDCVSEFLRRLKSIEKDFDAEDKREHLSQYQRSTLIKERIEVFSNCFEIDGLRAEVKEDKAHDRVVKMVDSVITAIKSFQLRTEEGV